MRGLNAWNWGIISRTAAATCHRYIEELAGCPNQLANRRILTPQSLVNASKRRGLRLLVSLPPCHAEIHRLLHRASPRHSKNPRYRCRADAGDETSCRIVVDCVTTAKATPHSSWPPGANAGQSRSAPYSPWCDSTGSQTQGDCVSLHYSGKRTQDSILAPPHPQPLSPEYRGEGSKISGAAHVPPLFALRLLAFGGDAF